VTSLSSARWIRQSYIKRVVGCGEWVSLTDGQVLINGAPLDTVSGS
jgi:hypothetical protein